jgi:gamma-glutamylcyclotransferase (GGCT)/AIG2-like uncharacterized protein YtfP
MRELLFIYGTLHPDRAPAEIADAVRRLAPVGPATIRGTLLDLGDYPGVLLNGDTEVCGNLFALPQPSERTWAELDAYEGFRADDAAGSLFVRRPTVATTADGDRIHCWTYVYNKARHTA